MASSLPAGSPVAVIGAGAMGAGIAQVAALAGHRVQLHDARFGAGEAAKRGIAEALSKQVAKGRLANAAAAAAVDRIESVVTLPDACIAALVVEAIVEELDAKRELFTRLENVVGPECILATNTSSLSITALAAGLKYPGRLVGMHFFNPAPLMPLVEVVSGLATSETVAATVFATATAWGKTPVHAASTPGFILIGLDVNFAVTKSIWQAYFNDPRYAPSVRQQELVAAGFLSRKSGRGFYDYTSGATPPEPRCEMMSTVPAKVTAHGDLGIVAPLADRIAGAGIAVEHARADSRFPRGALHVAGDGGGAWIALTDGRTATARVAATGVRNLVLVDLALDFAATKRLAVARADTCDDDAYAAAVGALRTAGIAVCRLDDVAALAVMRTVATLANEAADAVVQGVASPAAIDLAMQQGVNYPRGPLAWADALGAALIGDVLVHLAAHYAEDRYRISPLLARRAATGGTFHG